jgi:diguanylate cyclase (GGDEF)-like protein
MGEGHRPEMKPPAAGPAEGATAEAALTELRAVNERLLLSGLREQERAAEAGRRADALEHQALHDGLTGLPNRALFHDRLRQAVLTAQRERGALALLFIHLDRFKAVNDRFGHRVGDLLLRQVGARLRGMLRGSDIAARLGGDEFAVLLPGMVDLPGARRAARRIRRALHPPFTIHGLPHEVRASIGVACYPAHGADADTLMRRADAAMYTAKSAASGVAVAGFDRDRGAPGAPGGERAAADGPAMLDQLPLAFGNTPQGEPAADGSARPGDEPAAPGLAEIRVVNERLLIAGLREKELADQLRHQLAFTGAITGSLGEGVYALDRACRVTFVNPAAERLLGWTEADLLGRDARAVVHVPPAAGVPVSGDCPPL